MQVHTVTFEQCDCVEKFLQITTQKINVHKDIRKQNTSPYGVEIVGIKTTVGLLTLAIDCPLHRIFSRNKEKIKSISHDLYSIQKRPFIFANYSMWLFLCIRI